MSRVLGEVSCDLDPKVKVKGQKCISLKTHLLIRFWKYQLQILSVHWSHDVEGTRQHFI